MNLNNLINLIDNQWLLTKIEENLNKNERFIRKKLPELKKNKQLHFLSLLQ